MSASFKSRDVLRGCIFFRRAMMMRRADNARAMADTLVSELKRLSAKAA